MDAATSDAFATLGEYAAAGALATRNALAEARRSADAGRIPIAGAVVVRLANGELVSVATGHNGRIPAHDNSDEVVGGGDSGASVAENRHHHPAGYPTDHGETGCLRSIGGADAFRAVDWSRAVFATTLSPCVMCTRSLVHLHGLGLTRVVVAESQSFPGRKDLLRRLTDPPVTIVELTSADAIRDMAKFARRYPWDWAADIGEVPPAAATVSHAAPPLDVSKLAAARDRLRGRRRGAEGEDEGTGAGVGAGSSGGDGDHAAAVVDLASGRVLSSAADLRAASGGNPVNSAVMRAMGLAGSSVNLRDCVVVVDGDALTRGGGARWGGAGGDDAEDALVTRTVSVDAFGLSSLGACELFRPWAVCFLGRRGAGGVPLPPDAELRAALAAVGVIVVLLPGAE